MRSPPPEVATNTLPVRPASLTAAAVPMSMPSQKPTMPHRSGILLEHGLGDRLGLGRVPVGRLARDDLDFGMLGEHVLDALQRIGARRGRQRALHDRDLVRLAFAGLDDRLGVLLADLDPVRADESRCCDRPSPC